MTDQIHFCFNQSCCLHRLHVQCFICLRAQRPEGVYVLCGHSSICCSANVIHTAKVGLRLNRSSSYDGLSYHAVNHKCEIIKWDRKSDNGSQSLQQFAAGNVPETPETGVVHRSTSKSNSFLSNSPHWFLLIIAEAACDREVKKTSMWKDRDDVKAGKRQSGEKRWSKEGVLRL